jgi:NAD(P)-dependent dehydrogenase (short-subunit alcohol dehydrogenase family)
VAAGGKVALVTGCSSGVGLAVAVQLAQEGYKVYATMRNVDKAGDLNAAVKEAGVSDKVVVLPLDVCQDASVSAAIAKIVGIDQRIDVLVNNAGFSVFGGVEMMPLDKMKNQMETNLFGCIRVMQAVLPHMRAQRAGHIISVSSVGGVWGQPLNDIYCASKFALEGFVESMAPVYRQFNIHMSLVEPGGIKTAFIANAARPDMEGMEDDLKPFVAQVASVYQENAKTGTAQTAAEVAEHIVATAKNPAPPLRVQTNRAIQGVFEIKLGDTSGQAGVTAAMGKFYPAGWQEAKQ